LSVLRALGTLAGVTLLTAPDGGLCRGKEAKATAFPSSSTILSTKFRKADMGSDGSVWQFTAT